MFTLIIVNDVTRNLNRPRFIQIPSKRLKKDTGTQVNNSTFIFITGKVLVFPVGTANLFPLKYNFCFF